MKVENRTRFLWQYNIAWQRKAARKHAIVRESPTVLFFAGIFLLVLVINFVSFEKIPWVISFIIISIFVLPFGIEWIGKLFLTRIYQRKSIIYMPLRVVDAQKTYDIHDEVREEAFKDGALWLTFKHDWDIESHVFKKIRILGKPPFIETLDNLAMSELTETNRFGIPITVDIFVLSTKTNLATWNGECFTATSWATKETEAPMEERT